MENLTKTLLIKKLAKQNGLTIKETNKIVTSLLNQIEKALIDEKKIVFRDFGKFYTRSINKRNYYNPKSGNMIGVSHNYIFNLFNDQPIIHIALMVKCQAL